MRPTLITVSAGDLLVTAEYSCEGVEPPWGFKIDALAGITQISGAQFRRIVRSPRNFVPMRAGETCIAIGVSAADHPAVDPYCVVLARGMKLGIHLRFLAHPDNTHTERA